MSFYKLIIEEVEYTEQEFLTAVGGYLERQEYDSILFLLLSENFQYYNAMIAAYPDNEFIKDLIKYERKFFHYLIDHSHYDLFFYLVKEYYLTNYDCCDACDDWDEDDDEAPFDACDGCDEAFFDAIDILLHLIQGGHSKHINKFVALISKTDNKFSIGTVIAMLKNNSQHNKLFFESLQQFYAQNVFSVLFEVLGYDSTLEFCTSFDLDARDILDGLVEQKKQRQQELLMRQQEQREKMLQERREKVARIDKMRAEYQQFLSDGYVFLRYDEPIEFVKGFSGATGCAGSCGLTGPTDCPSRDEELAAIKPSVEINATWLNANLDIYGRTIRKSQTFDYEQLMRLVVRTESGMKFVKNDIYEQNRTFYSNFEQKNINFLHFY